MLVSPVAERNKDSILEILSEYLDPKKDHLSTLEVASGSGQHIVHFAKSLTNVTWQPSKISAPSQESICTYIAATKVNNVKKPLYIDVSEPWERWAGLSQRSCDVIVSINMLHFCSFRSVQGLFRGASELLKPRGILIIYGPFAINGIISPKCNMELDRSLQESCPTEGLRDVDVLRQLACKNTLRLETMVDMPEQTKCLIFRRA
uniref:Zgc:103625 n=1 Tax=Latimeria chalumnae TaxID=7897 RepID=H3B760_LATCH